MFLKNFFSDLDRYVYHVLIPSHTSKSPAITNHGGKVKDEFKKEKGHKLKERTKK
jgi:hypothetical protein